MKKYNEITLEEIKKLNGNVLDDDSFTELSENPNIESLECLGDSSYAGSCYWYDAKLIDHTSIDIYS